MLSNQEIQVEFDAAHDSSSLGGPKSEVGKESSRRNALKHGYSSDTIEVPDPERGVYERLRASFETEMRPSSPLEVALVDRICRSSWKLTRIAEEEDELRAFLRKLKQAAFRALDNKDQKRADEIADVQGDTDQQLKLLARYEQAAERGFHKALNTFVQLRKNPEMMEPKDAPPAPQQPSNAPRREAPANVQPSTIPAAPNEPRPNSVPASQTTVEPGRNGTAHAQNGRR
jgi:hypothetical protein